MAAALNACAGQWDQAVCLGDIVGYGPDPAEAIAQVSKHAGATIRGNHDRAVAGLADLEDFNIVARCAIDWTRRQLSHHDLNRLAQLPAGPLQSHGITLLHGSLHDEDEYVFVLEQALPGLRGSPTDVTFFGHTHLQGGFQLHESRARPIVLRHTGASFTVLPLEAATRYLLNPGSVGQPRDGDSRAAFAIFDLKEKLVEFWRVPYDIRSVQERMKRAGLPESLAQRLEFGH
jgi:predicted phosphodiesterase